MNAMQDAIRRGDVSRVRRLASYQRHRISFNAKLKFTPLHTALRYKETERVKILITSGASLDAEDVTGNKPIHTASIYGHYDGIQYLLKQRKGLVNLSNRRKESPIHLAVRYNHPLCVKLLIENGAYLQAKDCIGDVPIYTAIQYRRMECLQILLECGASVLVVNRAGDLPVEAAKDLQYEDAVRILENHQFQGLFKDLTGLGVETMDEFKDMLSEGSFQCFWNRVYLVGQYNVGKTTLAKNLVGDPIPEERKSTDGIWIYLGRAGMDIDQRKWINLPLGTSLNAAIQSMLIQTTKDKTTPGQVQNITTNITQNLLQPDTSDGDNESEFRSSVSSGAIPKTFTKSVTAIETPSKQVINVTHSIDKRQYPDAACRDDVPSHTQTMSNEEILNLVLSACRAGEYKMKIVPIDLWDFGGQKIYYMTHQLFISSRGVFVIIFNGSTGIHEEVSDLSFLPGQYGKRTIAVYLMHWVNSILTYCKTSKAGFPRIIFVATHKDMINKYEYIQHKENLTREIEKLFEKHSGRNNLRIRPLIFVNAKNTDDPEVQELRQLLVDSAFSHPRWGELMPTLWVPLELQLAERANNGQKIMSVHEVESINSKNGKMAIPREKLKTFFKLQHALGKYIYFDEGKLSQYVVIDPSYLIEVLRSVVTEEVFWPNDKKFRDIFKSMKEHGILREVNLIKLWEQNEFKHILNYKDYMIEMLIHLDIIIRRRSNFISDHTTNQETLFMVPCMIDKQNIHRIIKADTSIYLAYSFNEDIIPPAFLYKFLGTFVSMWKLKSMFTDSAIVSIDHNHDLGVYVDGRRLIIELIHSTNKNQIFPTIASTVQECLTRAIVEISSFYSSAAESEPSSYEASTEMRRVQDFGFMSEDDQIEMQKRTIPFSIEFGFRCDPSHLCFVKHNFVTETRDYRWKCRDHRITHDAHEVRLWFEKQSLQFTQKADGLVCNEKCPGLVQLRLERYPTDQDLGRLASMFDVKTVKDIFIFLGLSVTRWDDIEVDHPYTWDRKFFAFWEWKRKTHKPTFACLNDVLPEVDQDPHKLCEVFREFELKDLPNKHLDSDEVDNLMEALSNSVGEDVIKLGLELELKGEELQDIGCKYKKNLMEQTREVLQKWRMKNQSISTLAKAFKRIGKYGVLTQCLPEFFE